MPVYLAGRALASALGMDLVQAVTAVRHGGVAPAHYALPGQLNTTVPWLPIPYQAASWNDRVRQLVQDTAKVAEAERARHGALFIATSGLDGQESGDMDFHALADRIAAWLQWQGPVHIVSTACTSSMNAVLTALELLRAGEVTDALVLGLELDNQLTVPGFAAMQLLTPTHSKPYAQDRDGLLLGEAVAMLRLSIQEHTPWRILGGANVVDGGQATSASATAVTIMCQRALTASGVSSRDIDLIKVQAAGSPGNDAAEAAGLLSAFGTVPPLVSLKPLLGHCMGASGAAEIVLLLSCLEQGVWPVVTHPAEPALGVQLAAQAPASVKCVLTNILGFGGSHTAVVLAHRAS